jgi:hypothetical protein
VPCNTGKELSEFHCAIAPVGYSSFVLAAGTTADSCAVIAFPLHAPPQQMQQYLRAMGCLTLLVEAPFVGGSSVSDGGSTMNPSRGALGWASVNLERLSTVGSASGGYVCDRKPETRSWCTGLPCRVKHACALDAQS